MVELGRQGENLTQEVQIDVSAWTEEHGRSHVPDCGGATRRNQKLLPEITQSGNTLTWKPTAADTAKGGYGRAEVQAVKGALIRKSPYPHTHRGCH